MYSESDLEAAVAAGALTAEQAARLRDFVAGTRQTPAVDEEKVSNVGCKKFFPTVGLTLSVPCE